jgi:hypothetical protein
MAKEKKLTVKIYENRQLKEYKSPEEESMDGYELVYSHTFYPLYLMLTFNRKVKTIKSPTFEFLHEIHERTDLIITDPDEIEKNDRRLLDGYREIIEKRGEEFSLDLISSSNPEYVKFKEPVFHLVGSKVKMEFFHFFHGVGPHDKYPYSMMVALTTPNWMVFLYHLKETSPGIYSEFLDWFEDVELIVNEFENFSRQNLFPFRIDLELNTSGFEHLRKTIF